MSGLSGWHTRSHPHPSRGTFTPSSETLIAGVIRSTHLYPRQLVAAFFVPDFVVDTEGRVFQLNSEEEKGAIYQILSRATSDKIPLAGGYNNQWRIFHPRTDFPIHKLKIPSTEAGKVDVVSVYGLSKSTGTLEKLVGGYTELPEVLQEAFTLMDEARTTTAEGEGDSSLARTVGDLIVEL
ncbi:uncharacterized protein EI90DRAFT_3291559 [Cantharellus anzutake]|uniref:uncharacterized protein n=1 Tax=Cantharellus anzutake TaxID=1750568 RepID=UPI001905D750|nr:uncharacterized protein EI90DRAFT_3291559 [Cantharellus anzutake]KAF8326110.1 hypothetical protein EI90DRAFT_3291559 [Cantharellus anzutake]